LKKISPTVYLLKTENSDTPLYKIGYTANSVENRRKASQTGCPYKVIIVSTYQSEYAKIIENTLHNMYIHKNTNGEWFELDFYEEVNFKKICEKYHNIQKIINNHDNDN
jgi:hypothetical protein